jgi:hypothetical protein
VIKFRKSQLGCSRAIDRSLSSPSHAPAPVIMVMVSENNGYGLRKMKVKIQKVMEVESNDCGMEIQRLWS